MKNLIVRTITGVFFVAAIIVGFLNAQAMVALFALITGLTIGNSPDWLTTGRTSV